MKKIDWKILHTHNQNEQKELIDKYDSFVYLAMDTGPTKYTKLGTSISPWKHMKDYYSAGTLVPHPYYIREVWGFKGIAARPFEGILHGMYKHNNVRKEFFDFGKEIKITDIINEISDFYESYLNSNYKSKLFPIK